MDSILPGTRMNILYQDVIFVGSCKQASKKNLGFLLFFQITWLSFFWRKTAKIKIEILDKKLRKLWKNHVQRMITNTIHTIIKSIFSCKLYALTAPICYLRKDYLLVRVSLRSLFLLLFYCTVHSALFG